MMAFKIPDELISKILHFRTDPAAVARIKELEVIICVLW